jgi:hypothetical protein
MTGTEVRGQRGVSVYSDKSDMGAMSIMALDKEYPLVPIIREMMKQALIVPVEQWKRNIFNVMRKLVA